VLVTNDAQVTGLGVGSAGDGTTMFSRTWCAIWRYWSVLSAGEDLGAE
jgi:hypothetical protein